LLNPARAFSAMSATLTGYCLFRFYANTAGNQLVVPYLLAAGAFLALADSAWLNLFAAAAAAGAPGGQAESGEGGRPATATVLLIAVFATLAGWMCAMTGGFNSFRAAGILILAILVRHGLFRAAPVLSPLLGGCSDSLFLMVGMTAHPAFLEMIQIGEIRLPVIFFGLYLIPPRVLAQAGTAGEREAAGRTGEAGSRSAAGWNEPANRAAVWLAGISAVLIPALLALIMPRHWLSWLLFALIPAATLGRLASLLAYRSRRELEAYLGAARNAAVFLNAGGVASLGFYQIREVYGGWRLALPGREQLAALAIITVLALPAWFLGREAEE
jgi:hypothetical protein